MRANLEIRNPIYKGSQDAVKRRLESLDYIDNFEVNAKNATVSFDYFDLGAIEMVRKELAKLGYLTLDNTKGLKKRQSSP